MLTYLCLDFGTPGACVLLIRMLTHLCLYYGTEGACILLIYI